MSLRKRTTTQPRIWEASRPRPITSSPSDWRDRVKEEYADRPHLLADDGTVKDSNLSRLHGGTLPCGHEAHIWDDPEVGYTIKACIRCNWISYDELWSRFRSERNRTISQFDKIEKLEAEVERLTSIERSLLRNRVRRAVRWLVQATTGAATRISEVVKAAAVKSYQRVIPPPCEWCGEKNCDCAEVCCEHCHDLKEDCQCYCENCGELLEGDCECCPEDCECRECRYA